MALFTTFVTTPVVMAFYKPARDAPPPYNHRKFQRKSPGDNDDDSSQLCLLACLHGFSDVPSTINLVETVLGGPNRPPLKLYIMHLVELTECPSSIVMALRTRRNAVPNSRRRLHRETQDRVAVAFQAYGHLSRVTVRAMTAVSALCTMHDDISAVAEKKHFAMVVLPFHKRLVVGEEGEVELESVGHGWRGVNQRLIKCAPCSVGVLVDRGLGAETEEGRRRRGGGGSRLRWVWRDGRQGGAGAGMEDGGAPRNRGGCGDVREGEGDGVRCGDIAAVTGEVLGEELQLLHRSS